MKYSHKYYLKKKKKKNHILKHGFMYMLLAKSNRGRKIFTLVAMRKKGQGEEIGHFYKAKPSLNLNMNLTENNNPNLIAISLFKILMLF